MRLASEPPARPQAQIVVTMPSQDQTAIDAGTGLLLAISGLPEWRLALDRPLVPDAARALYGAFFSIREARILAGHTGDVNTVRYSSDDHRILTSSDDGT